LVEEFEVSGIDNELVSASQVVEQLQFSDVCDVDLLVADDRDNGIIGMYCRSFTAPLSEEDLKLLNLTQFPKNTIDQSTWAVTVFGEWQAHRNRLCLEENFLVCSIIYIYFLQSPSVITNYFLVQGCVIAC